jgi:parallel beta-helix repeat protein
MRRAPVTLLVTIVCSIIATHLAFAGGTMATPQAAGRIYYIDPARGRDSNSGTTESRPFKTIQKAVDLALAGDTIRLAGGTYEQNVVFDGRNGTASQPITLTGPPEAIVKGDASDNSYRVVEISRDYITLDGFTIDGLNGPADNPLSYREQLVYVEGEASADLLDVRGVRILNMTLLNAGQECVRLRARTQGSEVGNSTISNCGVCDFVFGCTGNKNGEGIYIGTDPDQLVTRDTTDDPSNENHIYGNTINTKGSECVDIKEGSEGTLVEQNICTGSLDPKGGGISVGGSGNIVRDNEIYGHAGVGLRVAGERRDDGRTNIVENNRIYANRGGIAIQGNDNIIRNNRIYSHTQTGIRIAPDGINTAQGNTVQSNTIYNNSGGGIEFEAFPQGQVCDNSMYNNGSGNTTGPLRSIFKPDMPCGRVVLSILVKRR